MRDSDIEGANATPDVHHVDYISTLREFNSSSTPEVVAQGQHDLVVSLWDKLYQHFDSAPDAIRKDMSFHVFVLQETNYEILSIALEHKLAHDLASLRSEVAVDIQHRINSVIKRWFISQSIFVFLFGIDVVKCRFALNALLDLRKLCPEVDIVSLYLRFEKTKPSTDTKRPEKDRLKIAITHFSQTAWPAKRKANKKANRKIETAPEPILPVESLLVKSAAPTQTDLSHFASGDRAEAYNYDGQDWHIGSHDDDDDDDDNDDNTSDSSPIKKKSQQRTPRTKALLFRKRPLTAQSRHLA
ncbi:hypothetical protein ColLi_10987 [Colletotrichum liriopes]|uniref:Uncharacterized protein n=1 Tax=Colletotrichum liriopes TaxID=708192 RepID=A0AA37LXC4_9PEZI|nr:hypothetical protein ColLi_10987 [Colletotrichum liriopes]